jgi:hypothetical protein
MGLKLPPDQLALYERIDEILWKDWDPIGVFGVSAARDDYRAYLPQVFRLILNGATRNQIAEYLLALETDAIELSGDKQRCVTIANLLVEAKNRLGL